MIKNIVLWTAVAVMAAAMAACSGGRGDAGGTQGMSGLDSLRALSDSSRTAAGSTAVADRYGETKASGSAGRGMHTLSGTETKAIYAFAGETLTVDTKARGRCLVKLYDAGTRRLLDSREVATELSWSVVAPTDGIYALQVMPVAESLSLSYTLTASGGDGRDRLGVVTNMVSASAGDFMAQRTDGLKTIDVFKEPKRVALRSNLKAAFSGNSRAVISVPVPQGAGQLVFSLRVSNNENSVSTDGQFSNRVAAGFNKIKLLGIPVYESQHGFDIGRLLSDARPPREDEAFCNMYVLKNQKAVRTFQDTSGGSGSFDYDVDLSQLGTQSCAGQLPCSGRKTVYIGFENERLRYDTFIWLEVTALKHTSEYVRPDFSLK